MVGKILEIRVLPIELAGEPQAGADSTHNPSNEL